MSGLAVIALILASSWLTLLTLLMLGVVRQVEILKINPPSQGVEAESGLMIGTPIPEAAASSLPAVDRELASLVFLSATCGSCGGVARELADADPQGTLYAVVTGTGRAASELASRVPSSIAAVTGTAADELARLLRVTTMPSVIQVENGIIVGKALLHDGAADLNRLISAYEVSDAAEMARNLREVVESAR